MELNLRSEEGQCLNTLLSNWMSQNPEKAKDTLRRVFIVCASKIQNPDIFLDALFAQDVFSKPRWNMIREKLPEVSRIYDAVSISLACVRVKELLVALEWSENQIVVTEILKWAEETDKAHLSGHSVIDFAPQPKMKSDADLLSDGPVPPREREVDFQGKLLKRFLLCHDCNNIVVGFASGQIMIYNHVDLLPGTVLQHSNQPRCIQCTCTEILAGYDEGSIFAWNIGNGTCTRKISVQHEVGKCFPFLMRWRKPNKLVVATNEKNIQIWLYESLGFTFLCGWTVPDIRVRRIEFDENYVILQDLHSHSIHVYFPNGQLFKRTVVANNANGMTYKAGKVIAGGQDKILRIWNVRTDACLKELPGHDDEISCVHVTENNVVLSGSHSGLVTLWDLSALFETSDQAPGISATSIQVPSRSLKINKHADDLNSIAFGQDFIVRPSQGSKIHVIDFPQPTA